MSLELVCDSFFKILGACAIVAAFYSLIIRCNAAVQPYLILGLFAVLIVYFYFWSAWFVCPGGAMTANRNRAVSMQRDYNDRNENGPGISLPPYTPPAPTANTSNIIIVLTPQESELLAQPSPLYTSVTGATATTTPLRTVTATPPPPAFTDINVATTTVMEGGLRATGFAGCLSQGCERSSQPPFDPPA